ncbi:MAG: TOBE domain-containing protein [Wolinella sp.]
MKISARNQIVGKITELEKGAVNSKVAMTQGGEKLVAIITNDAVQALSLAVGMEVSFIFKAQSVLVAKGAKGLKLSARNQIAGKVREIKEGAVNCEVIITTATGITIVAIITKDAQHELAVAKGDEVHAIVKASSILVGVN